MSKSTQDDYCDGMVIILIIMRKMIMAKNDDKSHDGDHDMLQVKKILSENKTKTNSVLVSNLNKVNTFTALILKQMQDLVFLCLMFTLPMQTR